ncbi:NAD(P)/FAD-dependent oxidoreductase [Candidatus Bathyarchaeota archaeon]|nr:NAD(P)/FAD-dependent oxidoreductase [Candidatus Bathyarchaeota archaeon]
MKTEETDILVIGAGPAGLIAAREAARRETKVMILEEHVEIGRPCHCAGLLSIKGLEQLGLPNNEFYVQNKVKGARFFSPSGLSFTVEKEEDVACVINRFLFDQYLAKRAIESGAKIVLNEKIKTIKLDGKEVVIQTENDKFAAKMIIDAEGASSNIIKDVGLKPINRYLAVPGIQYDIENVDVDAKYVEVHVGKKVAPGLFAWVIPLNASKARIGLGCKGANPKFLLNEFVKRRFNNTHVTISEVRSGLVITGGPINRTFCDRFIVVGDAAGQVKPTTGGGVVLGGICASIAGKIAAKAVASGDYSADFLKQYENMWKNQLGVEFRTMLLARRILNRLSDQTLDKIFRIAVKENIQDLFSAEGDMDFQSGVLLKLFKKKEALGALPSLLRDTLRF